MQSFTILAFIHMMVLSASLFPPQFSFVYFFCTACLRICVFVIQVSFVYYLQCSIWVSMHHHVYVPCLKAHMRSDYTPTLFVVGQVVLET